MSDDAAVVEHPPHYTSHPSGVECIDVTEAFSFNLGNAIKYIWRAGQKEGKLLTDLKKARWYVDREIQRLEKAGLKDDPLHRIHLRYKHSGEVEGNQFARWYREDVGIFLKLR